MKLGKITFTGKWTPWSKPMRRYMKYKRCSAISPPAYATEIFYLHCTTNRACASQSGVGNIKSSFSKYAASLLVDEVMHPALSVVVHTSVSAVLIQFQVVSIWNAILRYILMRKVQRMKFRFYKRK